MKSYKSISVIAVKVIASISILIKFHPKHISLTNQHDEGLSQ